MGLTTFLRNEFFKATRDSNLIDGSVNLITLEKWFNEKLKTMFNLLADFILNEEQKLTEITKTSFKSHTINTTEDGKTEK